MAYTEIIESSYRVVGGPENYYLQAKATDGQYYKMEWFDDLIHLALQYNPTCIVNIPPDIRTTLQIVTAVDNAFGEDLEFIRNQITDEEIQRTKVFNSFMFKDENIMYTIDDLSLENLKHALRKLDFYRISLSKVSTTNLTVNLQKKYLEKQWSKKQLHPMYDNDKFKKTEWFRKMKLKKGSL